jgi:uncharacterized membrane protein YbhN (UPF0104 family)
MRSSSASAGRLDTSARLSAALGDRLRCIETSIEDLSSYAFSLSTPAGSLSDPPRSLLLLSRIGGIMDILWQ